MQLWYEWTTSLYRCGNFVPAEALKHLTGYRSHYGYTEDVAIAMREAGSSRGLGAHVPFADQLIIDLDDGESSLPTIYKYLETHNLKFELWASGGKGFHVVLFHELIGDMNLPHSHGELVRQVVDTADFSLYRPASLISLPGRKHPKTGKRKSLINSGGNNLINVPIIERPQPTFNIADCNESDKLLWGLQQAANLCSNEPQPGRRHTLLWSTARQLHDGGLDVATTLDILSKVNALWQNPKQQVEVELAVRQAYSAQ